MDARKVCRLVSGTTSNVHIVGPLTGAGASGAPGLTWIVITPRHVPARNDADPEGAAGAGPLSPHAAEETTHNSGNHRAILPVIRPLLDVRLYRPVRRPVESDPSNCHSSERPAHRSRAGDPRPVRGAPRDGLPTRSLRGCCGGAGRHWPLARNARGGPAPVRANSRGWC